METRWLESSECSWAGHYLSSKNDIENARADCFLVIDLVGFLIRTEPNSREIRFVFRRIRFFEAGRADRACLFVMRIRLTLDEGLVLMRVPFGVEYNFGLDKGGRMSVETETGSEEAETYVRLLVMH